MGWWCPTLKGEDAVNARQSRALRGTMAAGIATILAATAHTLAGDGAPPPALLLAVGILATPPAVLLVGRRLALWRVAAAVLLSQVYFHIAFVLAGSPGSVAAAPAGHVHGVSIILMAMPGMAHGSLIPDAPMLVAHTLAAVLTVFSLHRGERIVRRIVDGIRRLLRPQWVTPLSPFSVPPVANAGPIVLRPRAVLSSVSRRGPPAR